jgi:hypothetical protein
VALGADLSLVFEFLDGNPLPERTVQAIQTRIEALPKVMTVSWVDFDRVKPKFRESAIPTSLPLSISHA